MNLISNIKPQDLKENFNSVYKTDLLGRVAVRGVLINDKKEVALMYIEKYDSYKLPGGGVDDEEHLEKAFERELLEETGYKCDMGKELGMVIEKRTGITNDEFIQVSFAYLAEPIEFIGTDLTEDEKERGFSLVWVEDLDKAIDLMKNSYKDIADMKYISLRDESILQRAKVLLS